MLRLLASAVLWALAAPLAAQSFQLVTVGAGEVTGNYFAAARAICEAVNRDRPDRLRCSPDPTTGSIYNLDALRDGQIDMALVQSDWQRLALEGEGRYAGGHRMDDLRSLMGLYPEAITIVARGDSGVVGMRDLLGKRVDIGHSSTGRRATIERVFNGLGIREADFAELAELPVGSAINELCAGRIDATILITGHPNAGVGRALAECGAVLVSVAGPAIDSLLDQNGDYSRAVVPAGAYPGLERDVPTFAVTATLVTLASTDEAMVEAMVGQVLGRLTTIGRSAPVLAHLDPALMRTSGLTAPLHPGAAAAFDAYFGEN